MGHFLSAGASLAPIPAGSGLFPFVPLGGLPPLGISARAGATCIRVHPIAIKRPSLLLPSPLVVQGSARARALVGVGWRGSSGPLPRQGPPPDPSRCPRPAPRSGIPSPLVHHRFGWRGLGGSLAVRLPSSSRPPPSPAVRTHRPRKSIVFGLSVVVSCPVRAWVSDFYCVRNPASPRPHYPLAPWPLGAISQSAYRRESDAEL